MDGSAHFFAAENDDQSLDVPPVAKAHDIAVVPAAVGARRRLQHRLFAETVDQVSSVRKRGAAMDEGRSDTDALADAGFATFDKCRQDNVDHDKEPARGARCPDVFVSYKAEDRKRVRPLVEALQSEGYGVWWDEQIGGGSAWRQAIETELNAAKCVLVIWSNRSVGPDGTFVQDEATRAQQRHVYVPVLIDKVHLPLGFGETQALPLIGWRGDRSDPRYQAVLTAVQRLAEAKEPRPRRRRRHSIAVLSLAAE